MSDKWDIVTDEKGIQLKIREPFLTKEEAINLSEALKRSVGFLDNIQKKTEFPVDNFEARRTNFANYGIAPRKIPKKQEKKWA